MTPIPQKIRKQIDSIPFYKVCAKSVLPGHICDGRITMEHAVIFGGKQLQELWAIIPLCEYGHSVNKHQDGGDLNKETNLWIALNRATTRDLVMVSKAVNYVRELDRLNKIYGHFEESAAIMAYNARQAQSKNSSERAFWYPVSKDLEKTIENIITNERTFLGIKNSPFEVIQKAVVAYNEKVAEEIKTHA